MAYWVGDIPSEDIVIEPARNQEPIDLTPFDDAEVVWRDFDGTVVEADFLVTVGDDEITVEWPASSPFEAATLYSLTVTLLGDEVQERLAPVYFVAQDEDGWHTIDSARAEWGGAPDDDARLYQLLSLAGQQVIEYASALVPIDDETPVVIPAHYKAGQLMQAKNLYNSGLVDPQNGAAGNDEFVLRPFPLDWMVQQVLRPRSGVPKAR